MHADPALPTGHGGAFLAIAPTCIDPDGGFTKRVDALIDEIHAAPKADGVERIYVPGEKEWQRHKQSLSEGIALPPDVWESLQRAAIFSGIDLGPARE